MKKGLTLVEIIVAIVITGILLAVAIPVYKTYRKIDNTEKKIESVVPENTDEAAEATAKVIFETRNFKAKVMAKLDSLEGTQ